MYTTDLLTIRINICYINLERRKNTMKNGKLNLKAMSRFEHELLPISAISDDTFFDILSASECLRFMI